MISLLVVPLLFLSTCAQESGSKQPYEVIFQCPASRTGSGTLRMATNATVIAAALCKNSADPQVMKPSFKDPTLHLEATLDQSYEGQACLFKKKADKPVFELAVLVKWTDESKRENFNQHFVTCEYPKTTAPPPTSPPPTTKPIPTTASLLGNPILQLSTKCPSKNSGFPMLYIVADVPAHAKAICKNGPTVFSTFNDVDYTMHGRFDQSYSGNDCLFYKKNGSNTYTVEVQIGWGEKNSKVISHSRMRTVSCAYDAHGNARSEDQTIDDWFLSPLEEQSLMGSESKAQFDLKVTDVLGAEIDTNHISFGKKIRLRATSKTSTKGFRALSCVAKNSETSYAVLRSGCGDGQVFPKSKGFWTKGSVVSSPYFNAFRLQDGTSVQFECNFTLCSSRCDGSSCPSERRKRSLPRRLLGSLP